MKTVVFGVTGGIAAFKMLEVMRLLQKENISMEVIMTSAAQVLTDSKEIEEVTGKKVFAHLFEKVDTKKILQERKVEHISLADSADCIVIAPATANIIAKLAHGMADDYLTTVVLAASCPVVVFPSMNVHMWQHPATQANIKILRDRGYIVIDPAVGPLACGYEGKGKLPHPELIAAEIQRLVDTRHFLQGKKVLVTAGGTKEAIDAVRFIGNHASGKMGAALADSLTLRGAEVVFIHGEGSVMPQYPVRSIQFVSADDLEHILREEVQTADALFHSAAVSDFTIARQAGKISSDSEVIIRLSPRKKILSEIKHWNKNILLVGFKAEAKVTETELIEKARKRMLESGADVMVANEIGKKDRGFAADTNEVFVVFQNGDIRKIPLASKWGVAEHTVDIVFGIAEKVS